MVGYSKRSWTIIGTAALLLMFVFIFSFVIGHYDVPIYQVIKIIFNKIIPLNVTWTDKMEIAVINIRFPRIFLACMVGAMLSLAGASYQSVFQNPMASPDILGASSGACFGASLGILTEQGQLGIIFFAFGFSLLSIFLVYFVAGRTRGNPVVKIILAGMVIGSLFSSGTSYIKLVADPSTKLPAITYWLIGSLSGAKMAEIKFALIPMVISMTIVMILRWRINLLTLGEEEPKTMGVDVKRLRLIIIICATILTATSVSVSGMIGWVGLIIPHIARKLVGNNCSFLMPASVILGALFLLIVDNISRNLLLVELPIGILTSFIGAPFFIYLMTKREQVI